MKELSLTRGDFPDRFVFATATSAYQIEGHAFGGAGRTHWDAFAEMPGRVHDGHTGAIACDHYHRWPEDLDLVRQAGLDGYRFSTSWARVMPDGVTVNSEGLDFYDRLVDGMLERGLKPMATLYHWELPEALSERGGWTVREIPERLAEFASIIGRRLGDRLWSTAPINEPWCVAWLSHYEGHHAPGLESLAAAGKAMHHVVLAHGLSIAALRAEGVGNLGAVCNMEYPHPLTDSAGDRHAADLYDGIYNRWFAAAMTKGEYPANVLDGLEKHLPTGWRDDMATIAQPIDWFGINYYTCKRLTRGGAVWPNVVDVSGSLPKTDMGWEIYPEGLEALILRTAKDYTGDVPLYVTENGMANRDAVPGEDPERIAYLDAHLQAVRRALAAGAPVKGFTFWSLLDNYEWAFGYDKRFGLVHVDFETQVRTPRASFHALVRALAA